MRGDQRQAVRGARDVAIGERVSDRTCVRVQQRAAATRGRDRELRQARIRTRNGSRCLPSIDRMEVGVAARPRGDKVRPILRGIQLPPELTSPSFGSPSGGTDGADMHRSSRSSGLESNGIERCSGSQCSSNARLKRDRGAPPADRRGRVRQVVEPRRLGASEGPVETVRALGLRRRSAEET